MSNKISNVIGTKLRIAQRRKFETDYDPISPPMLSDEKSTFNSGRRAAVRYWYVRMPNKSYRAEVVGPFHSKLYGCCSFGRSKASAKARLKNNLARNFGFIGTMLLSDKDEADTVGYPDKDLIGPDTSASPISFQELCGAAGQ